MSSVALENWESFKPVWIRALRYSRRYTLAVEYHMRWRDTYSPEGVAFDLLVRLGYPEARWEITPETYEDELDDTYLACIGNRKENQDIMKLPIPKWLRTALKQEVCGSCGGLTKTKNWNTEPVRDYLTRAESFKEAADIIEQL